MHLVLYTVPLLNLAKLVTTSEVRGTIRSTDGSPLLIQEICSLIYNDLLTAREILWRSACCYDIQIGSSAYRTVLN